jgi:HAD superfamily hydrolase (TIGR01509 family)
MTQHPTASPLEAAALLFDCDGTLVDSMGLHRLVWTELFARYDFEVTDEWWEEYANVALYPFVQGVVPDADTTLADQLNIEATALFVERLHLIEPLEHVVDVARSNHGRLPLAVVTGGYRDVVAPMLEAVGIAGLFDVMVTADDVTHSKPAPDLYARAAAILGVDPAACVAYEDSDIGIASARGAGIGRVVDIRDWPS